MLPTILLDMNTEGTDHNQNVSHDLHQAKDYTTTKQHLTKPNMAWICNLLILQKLILLLLQLSITTLLDSKINCEEILRKEQQRCDRKEQRRKRKERQHEKGEHRWKNLTRTQIECQQKNMNFDNNNEK